MTGTTERKFCNTCGGHKHHRILHRETRPETDEIDEHLTIELCNTYNLLICCGCDEVHLEHISYCSEDDPQTRIYRYPPLKKRAKPRWLTSLFDTPFWTQEGYIPEVMNEIYISLSNNCPRIAAMGIRALLEFVMTDKVKGGGRTFKEKLKALHEGGHVTISQRDRLADVLEVGHAAMHRQYNPNEDDLHTCLDIVETVIADLYVHSIATAKLRKKVPPSK